MKLYNTLTRQKEQFEPLSKEQVTIYTCGPTVYDYTHIGHWFTYVRWDMLIRTLRLSGLEPKWIMNITDVGHLVSDADEGEDKLEKGARREGKTAWEVAEYYTADFVEGMQHLNISMPTALTKATEHITEQIALIKTLEDKGYTYVIDDGVYFDTAKFEGYAHFAQLDLDDQQAGARVEYNKQKLNTSDFALWKLSPSDHTRDMEWDSPWGKGFPGWHIECSAMAIKYLGETIDIHAGGIDHIRVHHTNEIAQSEAATGKRFANYWLHSNHVMVEGEKISKSLGNGIRIQELLEQGFSADAIRLHILESNYRSQSKFSLDALRAAQNRLKDIEAWADLRYQPKSDSTENDLKVMMDETYAGILAALQDDLNTPRALMLLSQMVNSMMDIAVPAAAIVPIEYMLRFIDNALGIHISERDDITAEQKKLILKREEVRSLKNWSKSDLLRDELLSQRISVRDTPYGTYWNRN